MISLFSPKKFNTQEKKYKLSEDKKNRHKRTLRRFNKIYWFSCI